MVYLITYGRLRVEEQAQENETLKRLDAAIKVMGNWSNRIPNCWILETNRMNAVHIRDQLKQFLTATQGDRLFVARISRNWAGTNMGEGFPEWLKGRDFGTFTPSNPEQASS